MSQLRRAVPSHSPAGLQRRAVITVALQPTTVIPVSPLPLVIRIGGPIQSYSPPGTAVRSTVYAPLEPTSDAVTETPTPGGAIAGGIGPLATVATSAQGATARGFAQFPSTPVLDNFNRANEGPPPSSSWSTLVAAGLVVLDNQCAPNATGDYGAFWNSSMSGQDVEAFAAASGGDDFYLFARLDGSSPSSPNGYAIRSVDGGSGFYLVKYVVGVRSDLTSAAILQPGFVQSGAVGIRCIGSRIEGWIQRDDGSWWHLLVATDTTFSGASPNNKLGIRSDDGDTTNLRIEDFGGGVTTATTGPLPEVAISPGGAIAGGNAPTESTAEAAPILPLVIRIGGPVPSVQRAGRAARSTVYAPLTPAVEAPAASPLPFVTRVGAVSARPAMGVQRSIVLAPLEPAEDTGTGGYHQAIFAGGHPFLDGGVFSWGPSPAVMAGAVSETPTPGGAIATGIGPVARVSVTLQGATAGGTAPSVPLTEVPTFGGALAGGNAPVVIVPSGVGEASAQGLAPTPKIPLTAQGAIAGGHAPTAPESVVPIPGGGIAGGTGPTAKIALTAQGATAAGTGATVLAIFTIQGAIAGGNAPTIDSPQIVTPPPGGAIAGGNPPTVISGQLVLEVLDDDVLTLTARDDCLVFFPSTGILDDFDRSDEGSPMTGWGPHDSSGLKVVSNQCAGNDTYGAAYFLQSMSGQDVEAYITISTPPTAGVVRVYARLEPNASGTGNGYSVSYEDSGTLRMMRHIDGVGTWTIAEPDIEEPSAIGIRCFGSTIEAWAKIAGAWTSVASGEDDYPFEAPLEGDSPNDKLGLALSQTTSRIDDFGGGVVATPVLALAPTNVLTLGDSC